MSKLLRTLFILFIFLTLSINIYYVKASDDDINFEANPTANVEDTTSDVDEESNENVIKENASDSSIQTLVPSTVTSVTSKDNYSNANLELNNILCVILISIGVLLILFAIAILIRLKR